MHRRCRSCFGIFPLCFEGKAYSDVYDVDDNVIWRRLYGFLRNPSLPAKWDGKYCFHLDGVWCCYRNRGWSVDQSPLSSLLDALLHRNRCRRLFGDSLNGSSSVGLLGVEPLLSREAAASETRAGRPFGGRKERTVQPDALEEAKVDIESVQCL